MDRSDASAGAFYGAAASTKRGRQSVSRILAAAKAILAEQGYGELTLREVARASGMYLANVQHYYPTREALLVGLVGFIVDGYDRSYAEFAAQGERAPKAFFVRVLRYLLDDIQRPATSKLFFELWSLAQRHPDVAALVDGMYVHHVRNLEGMIAAISPAMPAEVRTQRAALIATQIEGLMVLLAAAMPRHSYLAGLEDACVEQAVRLATWS